MIVDPLGALSHRIDFRRTHNPTNRVGQIRAEPDFKFLVDALAIVRYEDASETRVAEWGAVHFSIKENRFA